MAEDFTEATSMNIEQATEALLAQSVQDQVADEDQETDEVETAEGAEDDAEVTDETTDDQTEETEAEEAEGETDEAEELWYELDGEEVSLAQLKEWREGGLKAADYTQKTQALSAKSKQVDADKIAVQQELQAVQAERAQLQDALASLAIDGETEPDWVQLAQQLPPQEYQAEQARWNKKQAQKAQAQQAYHALQQQNMQQAAQREQAALLRARPDWADREVISEAFNRMTLTAGAYGFTTEDLQGISDHRMLLVLDELASLKAQVGKTEEAKKAISKRVVKAQPRKVPSAKSSKAQAESKALKAKKARFAKSRSVDDATDVLLAGLTNS